MCKATNFQPALTHNTTTTVKWAELLIILLLNTINVTLLWVCFNVWSKLCCCYWCVKPPPVKAHQAFHERTLKEFSFFLSLNSIIQRAHNALSPQKTSREIFLAVALSQWDASLTAVALKNDIFPLDVFMAINRRFYAIVLISIFMTLQ